MLNDPSMWWYLFLGHLIGDYVFQNDFMAQNKFKKGWTGRWPCIVHCLEYSLVICLCMGLSGTVSLTTALIFFPIAFLSHYPIDRTSFAKWWLKHYNKKPLPLSPTSITPEGIMAYDAGVFFYWFVYVAVDNIFHLVLMTAGLRLITL
jgi:hypothetical protein